MTEDIIFIDLVKGNARLKSKNQGICSDLSHWEYSKIEKPSVTFYFNYGAAYIVFFENIKEQFKSFDELIDYISKNDGKRTVSKKITSPTNEKSNLL